MNLDESIKAHVEWRTKLLKAIDNHEKLNPDELCTDNHCGFGTWLYGEGKEQYGNLESYPHLLEAHANFHKAVGKVAEVINQGDPEKSKQMLDNQSEFNTASKEIGKAIYVFRQEAKL